MNIERFYMIDIFWNCIKGVSLCSVGGSFIIKEVWRVFVRVTELLVRTTWFKRIVVGPRTLGMKVHSVTRAIWAKLRWFISSRQNKGMVSVDDSFAGWTQNVNCLLSAPLSTEAASRTQPETLSKPQSPLTPGKVTGITAYDKEMSRCWELKSRQS